MNEEVDTANGFTADTTALDHYIGAIVNPALENFEHLAGTLRTTTDLGHSTMLGQERLAGSTEFTGACRSMLDRLFELQHELAGRQQALVATITTFRDNLARSSAAYARHEADTAHSMWKPSGQLETRLHSDGPTR